MMSINQNIIIKDKLTFEQILSLQPKDLINIVDLELVSKAIAQYFKHNISKNKNNKFELNHLGNRVPISLRFEIAFGLTLNKISGGSIYQKLLKVFDSKYIFKKLLHLKKVYKETHYFARSNFQYITDVAVQEYKKRMFFFSQNISTSGTYIDQESIKKSLEAKENDFCNTANELQKFADKTSQSLLTATIICPAIFHINPINGSKKWDGKSTPLTANEFQNEIWTKTQKKLDHLKIQRFGFWVKEVNASSAIHRHIIFYAKSSDISIIKKSLRDTTRKELERINLSYTSRYIKFDECDDMTDAKTFKITKYLIKNFKNKSFSKIDNQIKDKLLAHCQLYKYRRFGFFGLKNSLSLWRVMQKLKCQTAKTFITLEFQKLNILQVGNKLNLSDFLLGCFRNTSDSLSPCGLIQNIKTLKASIMKQSITH